MSKIRILHVTNAYPYPDVPEYGVFVKEQIDAISKYHPEIKNEVFFINGRKYGKSAYKKAIHTIKELARDFDIIHCHHLYSALTVSLSRTGKPIVLSFLNDWLHEMDGVKSFALRRILCNYGVMASDAVIFKSPIPKNLLNNKKIYHIPNGVNTSQFSIIDRDIAKGNLGLNKNNNYILFVSSKDLHRAQKRYDKFKRVVEIVQNNAPHLNVQELLLVNKQRDEVINYFNAASVHLMTSDFEGSPNSVKEAVSSGTPVVSTNVGNVSEMIDGLPSCWISHNGDPEDLSNLLINSLSSMDDRYGLKFAFEARSFGQEASINKIADVYINMMK